MCENNFASLICAKNYYFNMKFVKIVQVSEVEVLSAAICEMTNN